MKILRKYSFIGSNHYILNLQVRILQFGFELQQDLGSPSRTWDDVMSGCSTTPPISCRRSIHRLLCCYIHSTTYEWKQKTNYKGNTQSFEKYVIHNTKHKTYLNTLFNFHFEHLKTNYLLHQLNSRLGESTLGIFATYIENKPFSLYLSTSGP